MDLSNHVFVPKDDYNELMAATWAPKTPKDRAASTAQAVIIIAAIGAVPVGFAWGIAAAANWLEARRAKRKHAVETIAIGTTP